MKTRRHHSNRGDRQVRRGKTRDQVERIANRLGVATPLARAIDAAVRCARCGTPGVGTCDCWTRCACGWLHETGKHCRNPICVNAGLDA